MSNEIMYERQKISYIDVYAMTGRQRASFVRMEEQNPEVVGC